jgi:hypothetical protein
VSRSLPLRQVGWRLCSIWCRNQLVGLIGLLALAAVTAIEVGLAVTKVRQAAS